MRKINKYVIPQLTRCPWQQEDRVKRISRYESHRIEKKFQKHSLNAGTFIL